MEIGIINIFLEIGGIDNNTNAHEGLAVNLRGEHSLAGKSSTSGHLMEI